jgi:ABC-type multidrug transport system ATPase subunit
MVVIQTKNLCKQYGSLQAVKDLNLGIQAGEVYGFLGPNGAGKTTTILMILGMLPPTSGKVTVFGEEVKGLETQSRARIGVVPEHQSLYDEMTAEEYLDFFCNLHGIADSKVRIGEMLEYFGLLPYRNTRLGEYSHGMRQKVNISRGLLHDPDLLILDEPVLGLDPASVRLVRDLILSEKKRGKTVLISSHLLSEIEKTADRVAIMSEGELVMEGPIEKVIAAIGGENVLEIELEQIPSMVSEKLRRIPTVLSVSEHGKRLLVQVESLQEARSLVSRVITESGGTIISYATRGPDLEDAFLAITQSHVERMRERVR